MFILKQSIGILLYLMLFIACETSNNDIQEPNASADNILIIRDKPDALLYDDIFILYLVNNAQELVLRIEEAQTEEVKSNGKFSWDTVQNIQLLGIAEPIRYPFQVTQDSVRMSIAPHLDGVYTDLAIAIGNKESDITTFYDMRVYVLQGSMTIRNKVIAQQLVSF